MSHVDAPMTSGQTIASSCQGRHFEVAAATNAATRRSANELLKRRYGWRGYRAVALPHPESGRHFPLTATQDGVVIGTITVGLDGPEGLNCDRAFQTETDALRQQGRHLCEFTKLAIDPSYGSKHVLAALFHLAYLAADRLASVDTLLMEVNPRHVRYYNRILGASVIGEARKNDTVDAPAVLLAMRFSDVRGKIDQIAGSPNRAGGDRSLYSLAFNQQEEKNIAEQLARNVPGRLGAPFNFPLPAAQAAALGEH